MAIITSAPGVYIEEDRSLTLSIKPVATAVPVFVGEFCQAGDPVETDCIKINSWLDFTSKFDISALITVNFEAVETPKGKTDSKKTTAKSKKSLRADRKYEIDYGYFIDSSHVLRNYFENGGGPCYVVSYTDLNQPKGLAEKIEKQGDITLLCLTKKADVPASDAVSGTAVYTEFNTLLNKSTQFFCIASSGSDEESDPMIPSLKADQTAVYHPLVQFHYYPNMQRVDEKISVIKYDAKEDLLLSDLVELDPELYKEICDKIDRYLTVNNIERTATLLPTGAVAAAYCRTDRERGVWKAPANITLNNVTPITMASEDMIGEWTQSGINAIRYTTDRGTLIWGARTLDDTDNWRYIPVRRLFNSIEVDIKHALTSVVFEPNNQPTWEKVRTAIQNYLYGIWRQGGLAGSKEKEAYFVQIGKDITMTEADINQGKMIVKIGIAAVRPAEFIILQFTQSVGDTR